ncbi:30S ribosomal protein S4 [Candidatus Woesearchaeota archaeon]|nr:30S ribosomal protein S4 [Candidatus Woesearchaeota archaeon]
MGDPKKSKKKYSKPSHPWQGARIKEEAELAKKYGLKNKKELWKMTSIIKKVKEQARLLIAGHTEQHKKEEKQLINRLARLNIIAENANLDDVLGLTSDSIFNRRLQTLVFKSGLTKSISQARQFIIHRHIAVNGKVMSVPSYLVKKDEEVKISFYKNSKLNNEDHPERNKPQTEVKEEIKHVKEEIQQEKRHELVEVEAPEIIIEE